MKWFAGIVVIAEYFSICGMTRRLPRMDGLMFSRREFLAAMAAGGMVVAGELWVPGQKTIFIPKRKHVIWTLSDAKIVNRQYGYNEQENYSWGRHVRKLNNGKYHGEIVRIGGVDVTTDEFAAHDMERRLEAAFAGALLA